MFAYRIISTAAVLSTLVGVLVVGVVAQPTLGDIAALAGPEQPPTAVGALFFGIVSLVLVLLLWRPIVKRGLTRFERTGLGVLCLCTIPLIVLILRDSGAYWADGLLIPALYGAAAFSALVLINTYRILRPPINTDAMF